MRIVALEEHFVVPELQSAWRRLPDELRDDQAMPDATNRKLLDTADARIADMDDQGVDVQVLSLNSPGVQSLGAADAVAVARDANDALLDVVRARPVRFQAFAALPTPDPAAAAAEFERVLGLGVRGALLNGRTGERNMDDASYEDLYAVAERLRAPIHLHPQRPVAPVREAHYGGFGDPVDFLLSHYAIGWHYETDVQLLRMLVAGVFDRHPDLQVIVGHWGEVVLFFMERVQSVEPMLHLQRPIAEVLRENVWIAGSGMLSDRYLRWAAEVVGPERILYSTDYPFVDTSGGRARRFLEGAPVTTAQRDAMASGSWERLTGHLAR